MLYLLKEKKMKKALIALLVGISVIAVIVLIVSLPFMWLWNWIVPGIFEGPKISLLQTIGLMTLLSMIGSFFRSNKGK
jgi:hypothetical protein